VDIVWASVFADVSAPELAETIDFWGEATGTQATTPRGGDDEWIPLVNDGEDA
jgi:hypothetical protein